MLPEFLFPLHLVLGYVTWLLFFGVYVLPRLASMDQVDAQRAIATLHSFRFFGLVFILPGVVSPLLPARFAEFAAYGDFATGLLAILALLTARRGPLSWLFVVAFNLGRTYAIPIIYVPMLMITRVAAFYLLLRPQPKAMSTSPART